MITVFYHKKRCLHLAECFEELSAKQIIGLAPLLCREGDELLYKVKALQIISSMSAFRFCLLKAEVIERCIPFVAWVFEEKNLVQQMLPKYKGYYGPASSFDNLRMNEFHLSEMYYRQIIQEKDSEEAMNSLIAVLYRKAKKGYDTQRDPDGDIRVLFNHNEVAFHAKKIARWPDAVKQAVFLWYDGCRQQLVEQNPMVFKEPVKHSFDSQFDTGLYGMMRSLAGEKLGPVERIENMYVHTAMLELGLMKEEEKYFEEQLKEKG